MADIEIKQELNPFSYIADKVAELGKKLHDTIRRELLIELHTMNVKNSVSALRGLDPDNKFWAELEEKI